MNSLLKAPSLSSLLSGTDRGSSDSLLESLNLDLDEVIDEKFSYQTEMMKTKTIPDRRLINSTHGTAIS